MGGRWGQACADCSLAGSVGHSSVRAESSHALCLLQPLLSNHHATAEVTLLLPLLPPM